MRIDSIKRQSVSLRSLNKQQFAVRPFPEKLFFWGVVFITVLGVTAFSFAWQNPTVAPPGGNVFELINTGSTAQTKTGALTIGGTLTASSTLTVQGIFTTATSTYLATTGGNVGIGTTGPGELLEVYGNNNSAIRIKSTNANGYATLQLANDAQEWRVRTDTNDDFSIYDNTGSLGTAFVLKKTSGNVGIGTTTPETKLAVNGTITATAVYAPNIILQTVYKTWSTVTTNAVAQTYADITASDLAIVAKRTGSIFKITVFGQGYASGVSGLNMGIKYVGTGAMVVGVAGGTGDTWMGAGNGVPTTSWTITRVGFHNPGTVADTSYTYRAMLGLWTAGTVYSNYSGYSGNSTIVIEEIAQ